MGRSATQGELSPATTPRLWEHLTSVLLPTLDPLVPPQVPPTAPSRKETRKHQVSHYAFSANTALEIHYMARFRDRQLHPVQPLAEHHELQKRGRKLSANSVQSDFQNSTIKSNKAQKTVCGTPPLHRRTRQIYTEIRCACIFSYQRKHIPTYLHIHNFFSKMYFLVICTATVYKH